jgi:hypothetical protein
VGNAHGGEDAVGDAVSPPGDETAHETTEEQRFVGEIDDRCDRVRFSSDV